MAGVRVVVHWRIRVRLVRGGSAATALVLFVIAMVALQSGSGSASTGSGTDLQGSSGTSRGDTAHSSEATVSCHVSGGVARIEITNVSEGSRNFRILIDFLDPDDRDFRSNDVATVRHLAPGRTEGATLPAPREFTQSDCRVRAVSHF